MIYLLLGVLFGTLLPIQTAINSKLRSFVQSPLLSSMISFLVAELFLLVLTLVSGINPLISVDFFLSHPKWIWLGGVCGVIGLTSIIFLFQKLGSVQTVILPLIGQIFMGLLIDQFGWFHSPQISVTLGKIAGVLLMIIGVVFVIILPNLKKNKLNTDKHAQLLWQIYGVVVGMLMSSQSAINAELGRNLASSVHASLVSFTVGSILLLLLVGFKERGYGKIKLALGKGKPKWIWLGGFLGGSYLLGLVSLVPILGNSTVILLTLLGQMLISLVIDHFGLIGAKRNRILLVQILGSLLMITGVVLTKMY
ncbi:DMT family transporter [Enterococcus sp. 669A]|uniref:DMT family transporter n=1 Tax=Candidatus Enterococcus moelleringii TaxID=2815325 RepID=A0ABS3LCF8_9ENTE|nr:DMT family transporter [Enterococcus sp. 669A]MBO1307317.1 DMT family transporter [Enterococcus sp. 669A]